ncbi:MAG: hypothetical protein M1820_010114 [Bogoriella megaspora]|nr:MAG: hypothetical protein M1820_010114 [Bogoriella megaspora]
MDLGTRATTKAAAITQMRIDSFEAGLDNVKSPIIESDIFPPPPPQGDRIAPRTSILVPKVINGKYGLMLYPSNFWNLEGIDVAEDSVLRGPGAWQADLVDLNFSE